MTGVLGALVGSASQLILDTQTVTSGSSTVGTDPFYNYYGYKNASPAIGSINDGSTQLYSGDPINGLYFVELNQSPTGYVARAVVFEVSGTCANSGWTTMTIGASSYNRADATYDSTGGITTWTWSISIADPGVSGSPGPFTSSPIDATWV